jgi:hypothetical protein
MQLPPNDRNGDAAMTSGEIYRSYTIEVRAGIATVKHEGTEHEFDDIEAAYAFIDAIKKGTRP